MSDSPKDEGVVDPPENQGGGGKAEADSSADEEAAAVDPPENQGGGN